MMSYVVGLTEIGGKLGLRSSLAAFRVWTAVTRYLAAHFPTQRALLQTADIASRLMHGGELHRTRQAVG